MNWIDAIFILYFMSNVCCVMILLYCAIEKGYVYIYSRFDEMTEYLKFKFNDDNKLYTYKESYILINSYN